MALNYYQNIFESAVLQPVYYPDGKLREENLPKYVRAPFGLLRMKKGAGTTATIDTYVTPIPQSGGEASRYGASAHWLGAGDMWAESIDCIVVGQHEMGNAADADGWKGVHRFSFV